jgi:hypothetical protein
LPLRRRRSDVDVVEGEGVGGHRSERRLPHRNPDHRIGGRLEKAKADSREVRGPVDHRFVRSIYFRDPNGYVIELTASTGKRTARSWIRRSQSRTTRWRTGSRRRAIDRGAADRGDREERSVETYAV